MNSGPAALLLGGWSTGAVVTARSGLPVNVAITRTDVVNVDPRTGAVISPIGAPPPGTVAVINSPGGGNFFSISRPDLVPGVKPYLKNGTNWLNPAAFATPRPGTYGNLGRNALRGPGLSQFDFMLSRRFAVAEQQAFEIRAEVFNAFNHANFANPGALLPVVLPFLQPGQPFPNAMAAGFGEVNSTVGRNVGLGTSRQVQIGMRYSFWSGGGASGRGHPGGVAPIIWFLMLNMEADA
ncbi:MAG: hypothetical protein M1541_01665 [Acidobacteria bacterium]|nr:hypothetical protein [Acidobacteriota bacterium]